MCVELYSQVRALSRSIISTIYHPERIKHADSVGVACLNLTSTIDKQHQVWRNNKAPWPIGRGNTVGESVLLKVHGHDIPRQHFVLVLLLLLVIRVVVHENLWRKTPTGADACVKSDLSVGGGGVQSDLSVGGGELQTHDAIKRSVTGTLRTASSEGRKSGFLRSSRHSNSYSTREEYMPMGITQNYKRETNARMCLLLRAFASCL